MSITPELIDRTIQFEGKIPWMYLDTAGNVTVGVGKMLPDANSAAHLAFTNGDGGPPASDNQKRADWSTISGQDPGKPASSYKSLTTSRLPDATIRSLLQSDLEGVESGLQGKFGNYDDYPQSAKEGLIDMAFNLGLNGLLTKFPKFCAAVKDQNWNKAAQECHRSGVQESRNAAVKQLFLDAAGG